jgi:hypothetical protein
VSLLLLLLPHVAAFCRCCCRMPQADAADDHCVTRPHTQHHYRTSAGSGADVH